MTRGHWALVGATVGDPALLTLRAAELLRTAELVVHDALISDAILALIPARAALISAGRRLDPTQTGALSQRRVVWLSSDASSSASLSAEEAQRLAGVSIELEVVPGVRAVEGRGPLSGKTLIVARARPGVSELGRRLRDHGGVVLELPHVDRAPAAGPRLGLSDTQRGDLALLSSAEAVEAWLDAASDLPVVALGGEVVSMLRAANVAPEFTLRGACAEAIAEVSAKWRGRRVFIPLAANARTSLLEPLTGAGATPIVIPLAAHTSFAPARWPKQVDLVLLPSSLAALALYAQAPAGILAAPAIAIGPQSAAQAVRSGANTVRTAANDTIDALLVSVLEFFSPPAARGNAALSRSRAIAP